MTTLQHACRTCLHSLSDYDTIQSRILTSISCDCVDVQTWSAALGCSRSRKCLMPVQAIVQILQPLAGPTVGEAVQMTVNEVSVFAQSMSATFQKFIRPDGTFLPRLGEPLQ